VYVALLAMPALDIEVFRGYFDLNRIDKPIFKKVLTIIVDIQLFDQYR
jgi:hypothetical protein